MKEMLTHQLYGGEFQSITIRLSVYYPFFSLYVRRDKEAVLYIFKAPTMSLKGRTIWTTAAALQTHL